MEKQEQSRKSRFNDGSHASSGNTQPSARPTAPEQKRRPQGFSGQRRAEKPVEDTPEQQAARERENQARRREEEKRRKRIRREEKRLNRSDRKRASAKRIGAAVLIALLLAALAFGVISLVVHNSRKTVHMLPEITDVIPAENVDFTAQPPAVGAQDNFAAEGANE